MSCPVTTDEVIRYVISSRLVGMSVDPTLPVTVTVRNGFVTITGAVGDSTQREVASYLARTTRGVTGVRNLLILTGPTAMDLQLTGMVTEAIQRLPVNTLRVRATVTQGVVTLEGVVRSEFASTQIEMAAQFVRGVRAVHNLLIVENGANGFPF